MLNKLITARKLKQYSKLPPKSPGTDDLPNLQIKQINTFPAQTSRKMNKNRYYQINYSDTKTKKGQHQKRKIID